MSGKENFVSPSDGKRRLSYPTSASVDAPPSDGLDDLQHLPRADDASLLVPRAQRRVADVGARVRVWKRLSAAGYRAGIGDG